MDSKGWMRLGGYLVILGFFFPFAMSGLFGLFNVAPDSPWVPPLSALGILGPFVLGVGFVVYGYVRRGDDEMIHEAAEPEP